MNNAHTLILLYEPNISPKSCLHASSLIEARLSECLPDLDPETEPKPNPEFQRIRIKIGVWIKVEIIHWEKD